MRLILRIMQTFLKYHISFEIKKKKKENPSLPPPSLFDFQLLEKLQIAQKDQVL